MGRKKGNWKKWQTSHGYVRQNAGLYRDTYEHIVVAERALGKPLPEQAKVHHVDEDRTNNANSNLVICQDHAYHMLLHTRARVKAAGGNPNTDAVCGTCRLVKPTSDFYVRKTAQKGAKVGTRVGRCKACMIEAAKRRRPAVSPAPHGWPVDRRLTIPRGETCHFSKLTEAAVRQIRTRAAAGETNLALAAEFGVVPRQIWQIKSRRVWRHVA